jgi:hypothetical protein
MNINPALDLTEKEGGEISLCPAIHQIHSFRERFVRGIIVKGMGKTVLRAFIPLTAIPLTLFPALFNLRAWFCCGLPRRTAIGQNRAISRGFLLRALCASARASEKGELGCGLPRCVLLRPFLLSFFA